MAEEGHWWDPCPILISFTQVPLAKANRVARASINMIGSKLVTQRKKGKQMAKG